MARSTSGSRGTRSTRRPGFKIFEALISDDSGAIRATWLNQPFLRDVFSSGQHVILYGNIEVRAPGGRQLTNPQYEILDEEEGELAVQIGGHDKGVGLVANQTAGDNAGQALLALAQPRGLADAHRRRATPAAGVPQPRHERDPARGGHRRTDESGHEGAQDQPSQVCVEIACLRGHLALHRPADETAAHATLDDHEEDDHRDRDEG